jgi:hypothetical protein
MSKFDELAHEAKFDALLIFEDERKFTVDLYPVGQFEKRGEPIGTLEMILDHPEAPGGRFTLLCDWPAQPRANRNGHTGHTPGPWWVEPEEASAHRGLAICAADAVVATITPDENGPFPLDEIDRANARLIAVAPTMHKKLTDTVAWLDREINSWETIDTPLPTRATADLIERLTELRDDLAETLRKIEEARG